MAGEFIEAIYGTFSPDFRKWTPSPICVSQERESRLVRLGANSTKRTMWLSALQSSQ